MPKRKVFSDQNLSSRLNTFQSFQSLRSSTLFSVGGFNVTTNIEPPSSVDFNEKIFQDTSYLTLEDIGLDDIEESKNISNITKKLELNFDPKNLNNYAYFGSLIERIRTAFENIILNFPASLYIPFFDNNNEYNNIRNYTYDNIEDTATFDIPAFLVDNTYSLIYTEPLKNEEPKNIKNIVQNYLKYNLYFNDKSFAVLDFNAPRSQQSGNITITVEGNPFSGNTTYKQNIHLRPNKFEFVKFHKNLGKLEKYLLNLNSNPLYKSEFVIPKESEDGSIIYEKRNFTWPVSDGYNLDFNSAAFNDFFNELIEIAELYDDFRSDITYRRLITESLKRFDNTTDNKLAKFIRVYSRELDEIKSFIYGLSYIRNVHYNKENDIPDNMIKQLLRDFGWELFDIIPDSENLKEDLLFNISNTGTTNEYKTNKEVETEIWRRVLLNNMFFLRTKGTKKGIEAFLKLIGAPESLVNIDEFIYVVDQDVDPNEIFNSNNQNN